jgi:hypothetical protein
LRADTPQAVEELFPVPIIRDRTVGANEKSRFLASAFFNIWSKSEFTRSLSHLKSKLGAEFNVIIADRRKTRHDSIKEPFPSFSSARTLP